MSELGQKQVLPDFPALLKGLLSTVTPPNCVEECRVSKTRNHKAHPFSLSHQWRRHPQGYYPHLDWWKIIYLRTECLYLSIFLFNHEKNAQINNGTCFFPLLSLEPSLCPFIVPPLCSNSCTLISKKYAKCH